MENQSRKIRGADFKAWLATERGAYPDDVVDGRIADLLEEVTQTRLLERIESLAKRHGMTFEVVLSALRSAHRGELDAHRAR